MMQPDDDDLRARFARLKANDRRRVPEFHSLLATARTRARAVRRARTVAGAWGIAAAVMLVALSLVAKRTPDRGRLSSGPDARTAAVTAITVWSSPTASLLTTAGNEITKPPDILSSILDVAAFPAAQP